MLPHKNEQPHICIDLVMTLIPVSHSSSIIVFCSFIFTFFQVLFQMSLHGQSSYQCHIIPNHYFCLPGFLTYFKPISSVFHSGCFLLHLGWDQCRRGPNKPCGRQLQYGHALQPSVIAFHFGVSNLKQTLLTL